MRFAVVVSACIVAATGQLLAGEFKDRFDEAARTRDDAQVENALTAWKSAEPTNPEAYVAAANYYFAKARNERVQLSTKPPAQGDLTLTNPKSGEIVGSLGSQIGFDRAAGSRATDALREATRKFPERIDIWFGLAHIHQELGDFDAQYATLTEALKYATAHASDLRWRAGERLPEDPATFVPSAAQGYLTHYYRLETPEGDERFLRLAKLLAASYPKHSYPVNAIGLYYSVKEQWQAALPFFEKAHELDPNDPLVMMNLGVIHTKLRDNEKAKSFFEKVLASDAEQDLRDDARRRLSELN